jgi:hypothetical protein
MESFGKSCADDGDPVAANSNRPKQRLMRFIAVTLPIARASHSKARRPFYSLLFPAPRDNAMRHFIPPRR